MIGRAAAPPDAASREETASATPSLEARRLVRHFGAATAVDGVTFALPPGTFLTIFGPNGAGKTTLLRLLGGGLRPNEGEVRIGGVPLRPGDPERTRRLGVLSHQGFLYGQLTAAENLRFYGSLYGLDDLERRVPERLERVGLLNRRDDPASSLSRGMRQRLALARTLLHDPEVVLLDEPYTGLDAHAADVLRDVLTALRDGRRTVVLVTHALHQGLALADRVAVQVEGRFVHDGPRDDLGDPHDFDRQYRGLVEAHR